MSDIRPLGPRQRVQWGHLEIISSEYGATETILAKMRRRLKMQFFPERFVLDD